MSSDDRQPDARPVRRPRGFQWKSRARIMGWPLVHVAFGRHPETGKLLVARGIIAIGQFAFGLITVAQFGVGLLFAFGQFTAGYAAIGQVALALRFGVGQLATGYTAIGQFAFGRYVLAQIGYGTHVWSTLRRDAQAVQFFQNLADTVKGLLGR